MSDSNNKRVKDGVSQAEPHTDGDLQVHSVLQCGRDVMRCQFNRDGTLLAVGLSDGAIKLYNPDSGGLLKTLRDRDVSASMPVTGLEFTSSSQSHGLLLAAYACGRVRCWYVWGDDCMWTRKEAEEEGDGEGGERGVQRETLCLSVSSSGERAVTGGSDSALHLYDLHTQQRLMTCRASSCRTVMDGHRSRVFAVTFHPEREREFISGGWDNTVQFWDGRQERAVRRIWGPHVCGEAVHIDPDRNHILTGSWRIHNMLEVRHTDLRPACHCHKPHCVISKIITLVLVCSVFCVCVCSVFCVCVFCVLCVLCSVCSVCVCCPQVWDYCSARKVCDVPHDPHGDSRIYTCCWLGDCHLLAGGSQANMLKVVNHSSMKTESRLQGLSSPVVSTSVCPAGKRSGLIAASSGTSVYLLERSGLPCST
ncbi:uncharacterized protein ACJ7VT_005333 [Polymixia lowei]